MRIWSRILVCLVIATAFACGGSQPSSPVETYKTYVKAYKAKDITSMKVLLSNATMKMHEQEAKAQGVTVDDIVKRETLLSPSQTTVEYKDEKIDGDKATLQVKTSYGTWSTVPFVKEDGEWKIDTQGYANQMLQQMDQSNRELDNMINGSGGAAGYSSPSPTPY